MEAPLNLKLALSNQRRLQTFFSSPMPKEVECSISNSPIKLAEAGFIRMPNALSDEVECRFCGAKYSGWSGESPFAVHRTLNPKCSFLNTPSKSTVTAAQSTAINGLGNKSELDALRKRLFQGLDNSTSIICSFLDVDHPFIPKQGGYMLFESHRLLTFIYKDLISSHASLYAEAGFVYNVKSKSVFCVFCNLELDFQCISRSFLENIHIEKSPFCPFVNLFDVGNISMEAEEKIRDNESLQNQKLHENDGKVKYAIRHVEYEDESVRLGTYLTWPKWLAKAVPCRIMAECGFYYTGFSDKVTCFACGVGLSDWSPEADPALQHAKASPQCMFLLQSKGRDFMDSAQNVQLIVEKDQDTIVSQTPELDSSSATVSSSSSSSLPAAKTSPALSSATSAQGSSVLSVEAIKAALACQYTLEQITRAIQNFFTITFRYPNTTLLLGTLKAKDEHYERLCEKSQEVLEKEALCQKKDAQFQAKEAQLKAERAVYQQQITAKDKQLQRTTFELELRNFVRTESEQKYVEQIQQQREMLHQQREQIEQKDQVIEYKEIQIQDQEKHIQSLMAELKRRQGTFSSDDEESTSSDLEHSNSDFGSSSDEIPLANCKVCLIKPSQIMFLPCKHICCCDSCASHLRGKNCPICRENSIGFEKVYLI